MSPSPFQPSENSYQATVLKCSEKPFFSPCCNTAAPPQPAGMSDNLPKPQLLLLALSSRRAVTSRSKKAKNGRTPGRRGAVWKQKTGQHMTADQRLWRTPGHPPWGHSGLTQGNKALGRQRGKAGQVRRAQGPPWSALLHFPHFLLKFFNKDPQFSTLSPKQSHSREEAGSLFSQPFSQQGLQPRWASQTDSTKRLLSSNPSGWSAHHCATLSPPAWLGDRPLTMPCSGAPVPRTLLCHQLCPDVSATAPQRDCRRREPTQGRVSGVEVNIKVLPGNLATKVSWRRAAVWLWHALLAPRRGQPQHPLAGRLGCQTARV